MLHPSANRPSQAGESNQLYLYEVDEIKRGQNWPENLPLTVGIDNISNTLEKTSRHRINIPLIENTPRSVAPSWLKYLLAGITVVAGVSGIAAFSYISYTSVREESRTWSDRALFPSTAQIVYQASTVAPEILATQPDEQLIVTNLVDAQRQSRSPYSHYKAAYRNKDPRYTVPPKILLSSDDIALNTADVFFARYPQEDNREVYYDTVTKDKYYPLGYKYHNELVNFIRSSIEYLVSEASLGGAQQKYASLIKINDKIIYYKDMDRRLRETNAERLPLSPEMHAQEILMRRKLTTLYLAAEYIMDDSRLKSFYSAAISDNSHYSGAALMKRHDTIDEYLSKYRGMVAG